MCSVDLSIVVPLFDEENNVALLYAAVVNALAKLSISYELILVDDGSRDATFARAAELVDADARVRVIAFRRNYGQTAALSAGVRMARGSVVVTMDGDLQNDPTDIPRLLAILDTGYDVVAGWRRNRMDQGARVFVSRVANRLMALILGAPIRDSGCSLKAFRTELIQGLPLYGEMHRFIPALSRLAGAKLVEIEVKHHPRKYGSSKYGFGRVYKVVLDILSIRFLLSYGRRPLLWHGTFTAVVCTVGLAIMLVAVEFADSDSIVIEAGIGTLFISLGLFVFFWGIIGQMLALLEPDLARFALLAAKLSSRVGQGKLDNTAGLQT